MAHQSCRNNITTQGENALAGQNLGAIEQLPNSYTAIELRAKCAIQFFRSPWLSVPSFPIAVFVFVHDVPDTVTRWGFLMLIPLFMNFIVGVLDMIPRGAGWLLVGYQRMVAALSRGARSLNAGVQRVQRLFEK